MGTTKPRFASLGGELLRMTYGRGVGGGVGREIVSYSSLPVIPHLGSGNHSSKDKYCALKLANTHVACLHLCQVLLLQPALKASVVCFPFGIRACLPSHLRRRKPVLLEDKSH